MTTKTRPMTIAVTGPRALDRYVLPDLVIRKAIETVVAHYPGALWLAGGAVGTDRAAVDRLLRLGQRVQLVLPCPVDGMTLRWSEAERQALLNQIGCVESVEIVNKSYSRTGYGQRNRRMVNRAQLLVAIWDSLLGSDTSMTVFEAVSRGLPIWWFPVRSG